MTFRRGRERSPSPLERFDSRGGGFFGASDQQLRRGSSNPRGQQRRRASLHHDGGGPSRHSRKRPLPQHSASDNDRRSLGKAFAVSASSLFSRRSTARQGNGHRGRNGHNGHGHNQNGVRDGRAPPPHALPHGRPRGRRRSHSDSGGPERTFYDDLSIESGALADRSDHYASSHYFGHRGGRRRTTGDAGDSPQFTINSEHVSRRRLPPLPDSPYDASDLTLDQEPNDFALPPGHVLSSRSDAWLFLAFSSAVALFSLAATSSGPDGRSEAARGALAGIALIMSGSLAAAVAYRYRPSRRWITKTLSAVDELNHPSLRVVTAELILALVVLTVQFAVDSALLSPSSRLALSGSSGMWDANLYLSSWAASSAASFVAADAATARDPAGAHPAECTPSDPVGRGFALLLLASTGLLGCSPALPPGGGVGPMPSVFGGLGMVLPLLRLGLACLEVRLEDEIRRGLRHHSTNVHGGLISGMLSLTSLVCFVVNAHFVAMDGAGGTGGWSGGGGPPLVAPGARPVNVIFASWLCLLVSLYLCVRHVELYFVPGSRQIVLYAPPPPSRRRNKAKKFSSASSRGSTAQTSRVSDVESAVGDSSCYIYTSPMNEDDNLTVDPSFITINTTPPNAGGVGNDMHPPRNDADPDEHAPKRPCPPEENYAEENALTLYESGSHMRSSRSGADPEEEMYDTRDQAPYESSDVVLRTSNSRSGADPVEVIDSRAQAQYSSSDEVFRTSNSTNRSNSDPSDRDANVRAMRGGSNNRSFHADDIPSFNNGSLSEKSGYSPGLGSDPDPYPPVARSRSASRSPYPPSPSNPLDKTRGHSQREMRYDSKNRSQDFADIDGSEMSASTASNPLTQDPSEYSGTSRSSETSYRTEGPSSRDSPHSSSRGDMKRRSASRSRGEGSRSQATSEVSSYPSPKNGPPPPPPIRTTPKSAPVIHDAMSVDANVPVHSISLDNLSVVSEPTFFDPDAGGRGKDSIHHKNVSSSARRRSYHGASSSSSTQDNNNNNGALRQSAVDTMVMEALRQAQVMREVASAEGAELPSPVDPAEALRQTQVAHQSPGLTPPFAFVPQTPPLLPPPRTMEQMARPSSRGASRLGQSSRSGRPGSVHSFYSHSDSAADDENASAYDC